MISIPPHTRALIASHPLTRDRKWQTYTRFALWQVGSRVRRGYTTYNWIGGSKFFVKRGESGLTGNIYFGLHEFNDMGFLLHLLRPDDTFIDVGANLGSYSILAGKAIGSKGRAFEPVPQAYTRLSENLRLNGIGRQFEAINKAIGHGSGTIQFSSDSDTTNHVLTTHENRADAIEVDVTTLDEELQNIRPTLIKIDVEGYENSVLRGANRTLQEESLKALIVEIDESNRYGSSASDTLHALEAHGFAPHRYEPLTRSLTKIDRFTNETSNTIFVRDVEWVLDRIMAARPFSVFGRQA